MGRSLHFLGRWLLRILRNDDEGLLNRKYGETYIVDCEIETQPLDLGSRLASMDLTLV